MAAMSVGEVEVAFLANVQGFKEGLAQVNDGLKNISTKMGNMNQKGGALSVAAGNLISSVVKGAINIGKDLVSEALEVSSYNEKVNLSLGNVISKQIEASNSVTKYRQEGMKTVTITTGGLQLSQKEQDKLTKSIDKSAEAMSNIPAKQAQINTAVTKLAEITRKKGESDDAFNNRQAVLQGNLVKWRKDLADLTKVSEAGAGANSKMAASQNSVSSSYQKTVPNMVAYHETLLTDAQIAEKTQAVLKNAIMNAETMAIHSPFGKEDVINSMSNLLKIANQPMDQAIKNTQGLVDLGAAQGFSGKKLQDFSKLYAVAAGTSKVYWKTIMGTVDAVPGFMQKLADSMGVPIGSLQKLSRAGKISFEEYDKVIQNEMKNAAGLAAKFSETLPGLIESLGDVKKNVLADFFAPILDGAKPALAAVVDIFTNPKIRTGLQNLGKNIGKSLEGAINTAGRALTLFLTAIGAIDKDNPLVARFMGDKGLSESALKWATDISGKMTEFFNFIKANAPIIKTVLTGIATAIGAFAAIGPIISLFGKLQTLIIGLASPIGIISLLITAAVLAWTTNFGGFRDMVTGVWNQIQGPLGQLQGAISAIGDSLSKGVGFKDAFTGALSGLIKPEILSQFDPLLGIPDKIKLAWEGKLSVDNLISGVAADVSGFVAKIAGQFGAVDSKILGKGLGDLMTKAMGGLADIVEDDTNKKNLEDFAKNIGTSLGNIIGGVGNFFIEFLRGLGLLPSKVTDAQIKPGAETFMGNLGRLLATLIPTLVSGLATGIADGLAESTMNPADAMLRKLQNASDTAGLKLKTSGSTFWEKLWGGSDVAFGQSGAFGTEKMVHTIYEQFKVDRSVEYIGLSAPDIKSYTDDQIKSVFPDAVKQVDGGWTVKNPLFVNTAVTNVVAPDPNAPTEDVTSKYINAIAAGELSEVMLKSINVVKINGHYYTNNGKGIVVETPVTNTFTPSPTNLLAGPTTGKPVVDPFGFARNLPGVQVTSTTTATAPTMNVSQPLVFSPTLTSTAPISATGGQTVTLADATGKIATDMGLVATAGPVQSGAGGTYQAASPMNVNVPVNVIPTYTSTAGTGKSPVDFVKTWAQSQGWVAEGGPNSYAAATGIEFHIPINIKPSAGTADAVTGSASGNAGGAGTAVGGMASLIEKWTESMGWTKEGTGFTAPIPITVHIPVVIDATYSQSTGSGSTGGSSGGESGGLSGIGASLVQSMADALKGDTAAFKVSDGIKLLVRNAATLAEGQLGLNPIVPDNNAGRIGKLMADSLALALGDGITTVKDTLVTLGDKFEDVRTKQIEPTAASLVSMSDATLIGFVGPKLDTFRLTYLIPLNSEFARLNSLLSSIITQLGLLGGAAAAGANVKVPNVGGGAPPNPGGANTNTNLPAPPDKGQTFEITTVLDGEAVGKATYTYTNGRVVEETKRYG